MDAQLISAVDGLYAAFKRKPPPRIDGCPCCIDKHDIDGLISTPLRAVTERQLSSYATSLFLTVGGLGDFKYFLPRIFEVSATDSSWWPDIEIVLGKLALAEWRMWPADEQRAVQAFLDAWFEAVARTATPPDDGTYYSGSIDELVCGLGRSGVALGPYLTRLLDYPLALAELYHSNAEALTNDRLSDAFWEDADPAAMAEVVAFLRSDAVMDLLTR